MTTESGFEHESAPSEPEGTDTNESDWTTQGAKSAGLTNDGFALQVEGEGGSTDTVIFKGIGTQETLTNIPTGSAADGDDAAGEPSISNFAWFSADDDVFPAFETGNSGEDTAHYANSRIVDDADEFGFIKNNDTDFGDDFGFI